MDYDTTPIQKAVQCPTGIFYVDWNFGVARCPMCNVEIKTPIVPILHVRASDNFTLAALGNIKRYLIIAPNTLTRIHLLSTVIADNDIQYEFFEGTTVSANGTMLSLINNDRNTNTIPSPPIPQLHIFSGPTVTVDGTIIMSRRNPTGIFPNFLIRNINPDDEFILKQNTLYELKVTALIKQTNVSVGFNWLEVN